jgi:hypothetical protein
MFRLGVIEESLESSEILNLLKPYFFSQRIEKILDDEVPDWHINEYHIPDEKIDGIAEVLQSQVKLTWYSHAFNDKALLVILSGKTFRVSLHRDETWNEMLAYGELVKVEKRYIESIPLDI